MVNKSETGKKAFTDGHLAESAAALFLRLKGYGILEKNFKPPRGTGAGEIDLIAKKGKTVVFVEVKRRQTTDAAAESVSETVKQRRIRGAEYFLSLHPEFEGFDMRFDVILMAPKKFPTHIQNAFICE